MTGDKNLSNFLNCHPLWGQNDTPVWLASRFSLKRNLTSFLFPSKIDEKEAQQLTSMLKKALQSFPHVFDASKLSPTEKEALAEHFLMPGECKPQVYFLDDSGSFLAKILDEDHLCLECIESESNWTVQWEKLLEFESHIGKIHDFAFHPKFGYLSGDPSFCGTGLSVQAFLQVPCLLHLEETEEVLSRVLSEDISVTGLGGRSENIGDLMVIQNQFTLGVSEEHILDSVHKAATELMKLECERRSKLKESPDATILDKISRAYGLLLHSYQIETKEAFAALSLLKLAIDLQWATGMTDREISAIFFKCRRAHLKLESQEDLSPEELAKKRAQYLKEQCEKIKLSI